MGRSNQINGWNNSVIQREWILFVIKNKKIKKKEIGANH